VDQVTLSAISNLLQKNAHNVSADAGNALRSQLQAVLDLQNTTSAAPVNQPLQRMQMLLNQAQTTPRVGVTPVHQQPSNLSLQEQLQAPLSGQKAAAQPAPPAAPTYQSQQLQSLLNLPQSTSGTSTPGTALTQPSPNMSLPEQLQALLSDQNVVKPAPVEPTPKSIQDLLQDLMAPVWLVSHQLPAQICCNNSCRASSISSKKLLFQPLLKFPLIFPSSSCSLSLRVPKPDARRPRQVTTTLSRAARPRVFLRPQAAVP
jgi:hypothetical protein